MDAPRFHPNAESTHGRWNWFPGARTEFVATAQRIDGPARLQSVKQAQPTLLGISKNFHNHL
jgi:hypothetical protein